MGVLVVNKDLEFLKDSLLAVWRKDCVCRASQKMRFQGGGGFGAMGRTGPQGPSSDRMQFWRWHRA